MSEGDNSIKEELQRLGRQLKRLRDRQKATIDDVSGAVEISSSQLDDIENGKHRPSEDILLLLSNYFGLKDSDAIKLWELAGYEQKAQANMPNLNDVLADAAKTAMLLVPVDNRVIYSDMVHVSGNQYGLVLSFMQRGNSGGQNMTVSKIGMSKEHAKSVIELLQKTLHQMEPKALPEPNVELKKPKRAPKGE